MNLFVVQTITQNILSVGEVSAPQDMKNPKFTKESVIRKHSDIFGEELGHMKGKGHPKTDPVATPTVMPPTRACRIKGKLEE